MEHYDIIMPRRTRDGLNLSQNLINRAGYRNMAHGKVWTLSHESYDMVHMLWFNGPK